jgi:hypothetical protein
MIAAMDQHATVPYPLYGYQIQPNELMRPASHIAAIISSKLYTTVGSRPHCAACRVVGTLNPCRSPKMKKNIWRAIIEVSFIVFLFYANLLMGEFERSGMGEKRGLSWAVVDVFTAQNFGIALIAAVVGYILFEFLRTRF